MTLSTIPQVPDHLRVATATLTASVGPIALGSGFPIYDADSVQVWLEGDFVDPADYTLASASSAVLPWSDAQVTFDVAKTGAVLIAGWRNPYTRTAFTDGGVTARSLNYRLARLEAMAREVYDGGPLPAKSIRAGKGMVFDNSGNAKPSTAVPPPIQSADILDSTAAGRAMLKAADSDAQVVLLALIATDITDSSSLGRTLLKAVNAAAALTALGATSLGTQVFQVASPTVLRRLAYPAGATSIEEFGAVAGGADCTAALAAACGATGVILEKNPTLFIPAGNWQIDSTIGNIEYPINIVGGNMSTSVLLQKHNGTALLFNGKNGTGGSLKNISIVMDYIGAVGANTVGLYLQAVAYGGSVGSPTLGHSPDFFEAENVNITSFGTARYAYGFIIDGDLRQGYVGDAAQGLVGIRNISLRNVDVFNTTTGNAGEVRQGRSISLDRIALFQGAGTDNTLLITGPSGSFPSAVVNLINSNVGDLTFAHCLVGSVAASNCAQLTFTVDASDISFIGNNSGVTNNGTNCTVDGT